MPMLSTTMTMARVKGGKSAGRASARRSRMLGREVVRDRPLRGNRGDGVLEDQVIGAVDLDDHGEAIEVLDARVELPAVDEMDTDLHLLAARIVEEHILDVRLRRGCGAGLCNLGHHEASPGG